MTPADEAAVRQLNDASVHQTGPMDGTLFAHLLALGPDSVVIERDGAVAAFLILLPGDAVFDGENFGWFAARVRTFAYVDRIVVATHARGQGLGHRLYAHVADGACARGLHWIAAEVNQEPPNETSLAFHAKHGFVQVGTRCISNGKVVSYQLRGL